MTNTDIPAPPPSPAAATKPSGFQRIIGVLISPNETFASIARQPDFLAPLLVIMVLAAVTGIIFAQRVDFTAPAREAMEQRGNVTEAQMESALRITAIVSKVIAYGSPLIAVVALLIVAAVMLLAFRLMGGEGDFKQAFSGTLYAWMPLTIQNIITTAIVAVRSGVTALDLPTLVMSNPAFLVSMKDHPLLFAVLASIDIFTIWTLALFTIGFAYASRFSKSKSSAIVIGVWVIWTLVKLIGPAIRALKG
jgi:hypothetical protein